jgi:hypothetical protein
MGVRIIRMRGAQRQSLPTSVMNLVRVEMETKPPRKPYPLDVSDED